jgi:hypothetical protein
MHSPNNHSIGSVALILLTTMDSGSYIKWSRWVIGSKINATESAGFDEGDGETGVKVSAIRGHRQTKEAETDKQKT